VTGLLDFARQNKVTHQAADIRELVTASLPSLQRPENVELDITHEETDPIAEVDRDQLIQVILNLLVNACDAMPLGGKLSIRTSGDDTSVSIEVSDTGTGIRQEILKKLFEPFFTTKAMGKGTGLGLSVVYGIVKLHRGNITVDSNADPKLAPTGSTFRVNLPRCAPAAKAQP